MNAFKRFGAWLAPRFWRVLAVFGVMAFLAIYAVNTRYWYQSDGLLRTDRWTGRVDTLHRDWLGMPPSHATWIRGTK